jgi:hypothetical protein
MLVWMALLAVVTIAQQPATGPTKAFAQLPGETGHHLHNAHVVTSKVVSGAQPDGEASFIALQQLNIKTIISVDGAKPNVELARKYGMKYIHLPIGYDGVGEAQGKAIAKAINESPGTVYVHCHHGRHRSAAAVAVACVYNGQLKPEQAESVLKTFGTGANYLGLWKDAREARPVDAKELAELQVEFVEVAEIGDIVAAMIAIDQRWDHLKLSQAINFGPPPDHPDVNPPHEALQLQEHFQEIARFEESEAKPAGFKQMLAESQQQARALHIALSATPQNLEAANAAYKSIAASCTACHKAYRD